MQSLTYKTFKTSKIFGKELKNNLLSKSLVYQLFCKV